MKLKSWVTSWVHVLWQDHKLTAVIKCKLTAIRDSVVVAERGYVGTCIFKGIDDFLTTIHPLV